jgi:signal transduction histidine kinase/ligand-binding sensor domain-containing protein
MAVRGNALGAVLAALLACPCAFALNPALDVSQYGHSLWRFRDGVAKEPIRSMAQTPDGYLWLGTDFGLYRFDGVRAVPWQPPPDQHLPSVLVERLMAARDGTLWIGTYQGLASWKDGKLTHYAEVSGLNIFALLEDHEGSIWIGAFGVPEGKLCEIRKGNLRCYPEIGRFGKSVFGLHEDGSGTLWVGLLTGVCRWKPGPPEFYRVPGVPSGVQAMAEGDDGALLILTQGGVKRLLDGKMGTAYTAPNTTDEVAGTHMLRDRNGGVWTGTSGRGMVHRYQGRTDVFSQADGLSGDLIYDFFEDREGNIWVTTDHGLDRFREFPITTYSTNQGLADNLTGAVLGARDGSIWASTHDGLYRLNHGQIAVYRQRSVRVRSGIREIVVAGLPDDGFESLFEDSRGRIWVSTKTGIGYLENDRFIPTAVPSGNVDGFGEDEKGGLWITEQDLGLFRLSPANEVEQISPAALGRKDPAWSLAIDRLQGGLWLGFIGGGVAWFRDGSVRASYSAANGLGDGRVNQLRFDNQGALWAATDGGLSRLNNGRIATLTGKNGLPCDGVQWMIEDSIGSVWLNMPCGMVRVARSELDAWAAAMDRSQPPANGRGSESITEPRPLRSSFLLHTTVFDSSNGVRNPGAVGGYTPRMAQSPDGRLWFITLDGLSVVDPRHLPFNKLPPPVHIEQITADRKNYGAVPKLRLPALVRDVEIDYTALSMAAPERMRFRFELEGRDGEWHEVGNRRQAFYADLPPRNYRFRVMAANNDGVWNEAGASLDFAVDPAYYQTTWFRALIAAAVLGLLAGLYRLRLFYLRRQFAVSLEARVGERTRIARDLHDTLLQSFQGVLLKFSTIQYMIRTRPDEAVQVLERSIEQARAAINEGRNAVQGLRSSMVVANDLARAIGTFGDSMSADHDGADGPEFRVHVEGPSRDLPPLVRDEVYRIGCEAVRNAFQHANAKRIEVELRYDPRAFRLRVVDNGKGIDPAVLNAGGRAGHHGLPGLNERAALAGGKLSVWSRAGSGTEIELAIPGGIAYTKPKTPAPTSAGTTGAGEA